MILTKISQGDIFRLKEWQCTDNERSIQKIRPWVVVSNNEYASMYNSYLCVPITHTPRVGSVQIDTNSYVLPWQIRFVDGSEFIYPVGKLDVYTMAKLSKAMSFIFTNDALNKVSDGMERQDVFFKEITPVEENNGMPVIPKQQVQEQVQDQVQQQQVQDQVQQQQVQDQVQQQQTQEQVQEQTQEQVQEDEKLVIPDKFIHHKKFYSNPKNNKNKIEILPSLTGPKLAIYQFCYAVINTPISYTDCGVTRATLDNYMCKARKILAEYGGYDMSTLYKYKKRKK